MNLRSMHLNVESDGIRQLMDVVLSQRSDVFFRVKASTLCSGVILLTGSFLCNDNGVRSMIGDTLLALYVFEGRLGGK